MFKRDFMEYHADRFTDFSLMIYRKQQLKAVIPANLTQDVFFSHQGLSYGGVVIDEHIRLGELVAIVREVLLFLHMRNIQKWYLKNIPAMYHTHPAGEIDWILFKLQATLYRRDAAVVIDNSAQKIPYQQRRMRAVKKAARSPFTVQLGYEQLAPFWNELLIPNLLERHGVAPVHSLQEIQRLARCFPQNIVQHNVYLNHRIVAGCTLFLNQTVAHAQYISANAEGRSSGGLDFLFDQLIRQTYARYRYFSFGISNENNGQLINSGLQDWKEGFGGRTMVHDFYAIETANYPLLDHCMLVK